MKNDLTKYFYDFFQKTNPSLPCKEFMLTEGLAFVDVNQLVLKRLVKKYFYNQCNFDLIREDIKESFALLSYGEYFLNAIFLICCSHTCKLKYSSMMIDESIFWDTFADLVVKLEECFILKGEYGIFIENWFTPFFQLKAFKLGRFQYRIREYKYNDPYYLNGKPFISKGDEVISVHIPRGISLTKEQREDSYLRAKVFFKKFFGIDVLKLICTSWLLYGPNSQILPSSFNIVDFMNDWDIYANINDENFTNCWKIFGVNYNGVPADLPEKTSLQRCYKSWLIRGNKLGRGVGVKIIN